MFYYNCVEVELAISMRAAMAIRGSQMSLWITIFEQLLLIEQNNQPYFPFTHYPKLMGIYQSLTKITVSYLADFCSILVDCSLSSIGYDEPRSQTGISHRVLVPSRCGLAWEKYLDELSIHTLTDTSSKSTIT